MAGSQAEHTLSLGRSRQTVLLSGCAVCVPGSRRPRCHRGLDWGRARGCVTVSRCSDLRLPGGLWHRAPFRALAFHLRTLREVAGRVGGPFFHQVVCCPLVTSSAFFVRFA